ncbi:hypothetical protein BQ8482_110247 [Mesorhizobium delmotii]|uniref:Uncharacterized protein n=1 Tax=Mesorhizobium delmotii TaxID=1631247 RepID=A0A2P9AB59_9HYPH|nr:hypothetical protein BQ8482_110247 [Mesorhizobium delmotii]
MLYQGLGDENCNVRRVGRDSGWMRDLSGRLWSVAFEARPEMGVAGMPASPHGGFGLRRSRKKQPGWGTGVFLGPYGLGLAAAIKEHQQKQRKLFARAVHLRCSSLPLPKELQSDLSPQAASANQTKYP